MKSGRLRCNCHEAYLNSNKVEAGCPLHDFVMQDAIEFTLWCEDELRLYLGAHTPEQRADLYKLYRKQSTKNWHKKLE